jgi:hypothetical protein
MYIRSSIPDQKTLFLKMAIVIFAEKPSTLHGLFPEAKAIHQKPATKPK